jgi:hypothetical protein
MSEYIYSGESQVRVSLRYNETADAEVFGQQIDQMLKKGVYEASDPLLSIVTNTSVTLYPFTVVIRSEDTPYIDSSTEGQRIADISVKATTKVNTTLTSLSFAKPYIVAELYSPAEPSETGYIQDAGLSIRVKDVSAAERNENTQILLGKLKYRDDVGIKDELYEIETDFSMQKAPLYEAESWLGEFKAFPTTGKSVQVNGGNLEGVIIPSISVTYGVTPGLPLPTAGSHRYDMFWIDDENVNQTAEP